ncbi:MAG: thiol:disulfide interchange protein DsbA/DsbL [Pseudomonadota bacterium]|nr:thiol:disulfide interchange protein DsbA/DsbL [Pseudomonadota bacterium]
MTSRLVSMTRLPLILAAVLAAAACTKDAPEPTATEPAPAAAAPAATATAPTTEATAAGTPDANAPAGPIVPPTGPAPVAGTDYVEIPGGQPYTPGEKIEVVEVFGYTCPACASFEPLANAWKARLPADVEFEPVAAPFGGFWNTYAKAFYTAQSMGLIDKTHDAMFRAIHVERSLPVQPAPSDEQIAQFYVKFGADPKAFQSTMASFATNAKLRRAQQFLETSGVDSTPTMVVNGKYRVTGRGFDEILRITDHLIARERAASGTPAAQDEAAAETPAGS